MSELSHLVAVVREELGQPRDLTSLLRQRADVRRQPDGLRLVVAAAAPAVLHVHGDERDAAAGLEQRGELLEGEGCVWHPAHAVADRFLVAGVGGLWLLRLALALRHRHQLHVLRLALRAVVVVVVLGDGEACRRGGAGARAHGLGLLDPRVVVARRDAAHPPPEVDGELPVDRGRGQVQQPVEGVRDELGHDTLVHLGATRAAAALRNDGRAQLQRERVAPPLGAGAAVVHGERLEADGAQRLALDLDLEVESVRVLGPHELGDLRGRLGGAASFALLRAARVRRRAAVGRDRTAETHAQEESE